MKHVLVSLLSSVLFLSFAGAQDLSQQFPEAPEPVTRRADGGLQHDYSVREPKTLTKKFLAAHGVFLAANVFDIEMTHQGIAHHNCVEGGFDGDRHPSRGELYAKDMTVFTAITALDWLFQKAGPPKAFSWVPYMGAGYGTAVHLKGGLAWASCW